jgi:hypothetical protein
MNDDKSMTWTEYLNIDYNEELGSIDWTNRKKVCVHTDVNNRYHNENGPAYIIIDRDAESIEESKYYEEGWCKHGKFHRVGGRAIFNKGIDYSSNRNKNTGYWLDGKHCTEEESMLLFKLELLSK